MEFMLPVIIEQAGPLIVASVVPAIVAAFKKFWPTMPHLLKPLAAAAIGPAIDIGVSALAGVQSSGVTAALVGLAGVGIREVGVQIKEVVKQQ